MHAIMRFILTSAGGLLLAAVAWTATAAEADLTRYAGSSSNLSAVVTAITLVEPCDGGITLLEEVIESYQVVELIVACSSDQDDSRTVVLRFDMLEGGGLRPASFGRLQ